MSKRSRRAFIAITLVGISLLGVAAAEFGLRWQRARIAGSDRLDPGLILFDSALGWRLNPNWTGNHQHHDFSVSYTIAANGFRHAPSADRDTVRDAENPKRIAIVGDSFTFGLGVNDSETFVESMNRMEGEPDGPRARWINYAVPGYSTDQQYLLIRDRILDDRPAAIALIVYLGNDLFDNALAYPLQLNQSKPHFTLDADGSLVRHNDPVPKRAKPPEEARRNTLRRLVTGTADADDRPGWTSRFLLAQRFTDALGAGTGTGAGSSSPPLMDVGDRFDPYLDLFDALIERIRSLCEDRGVELILVLMPGRSYVEEPTSLSAQFQEVFRSGIVSEQREAAGVSIFDLAIVLRERWTAGGNKKVPWFYPHDGHLTAEGHRIVGEILSDSLRVPGPL